MRILMGCLSKLSKNYFFYAKKTGCFIKHGHRLPVFQKRSILGIFKFNNQTVRIIMFHDQSEQYLEKKYPPFVAADLNIYNETIGFERVERLKQLALPLERKVWAHVNSTYEGGGVAEMLKSVIPLARGLGIDAQWHCMEAHTEDFFFVTKKFHDLIQGVEQPFSTEELHGVYIDNSLKNFENYTVKADFTIVHDPQPCATSVFGNYEGPKLWRCHIDTTSANKLIWNFFLPFINHYDGAIFTDKSFVKPGVKKPVYQIAPSIDPLSLKNRQLTKAEARRILQPLFEKHNIECGRPIVLAVSRYDIHKNQATIIKAFKQIKEDKEVREKNPLLVMVGNTATDDPDGLAMYGRMEEERENDVDIFLLMNIENNDENIGALMRLANQFVHVSTKEGFGLVVTEALWQGTPVIGSNVGGIPQQVVDNKTGFLVEPFDVEKIKQHMKYLLLHPDEGEIL
ncbi:MAG TPA: glycosyltransferase, partial [Mariniphaga anaerophila]|nr:glycosyltransferase [Mariniphaga anaerophila]